MQSNWEKLRFKFHSFGKRRRYIVLQNKVQKKMLGLRRNDRGLEKITKINNNNELWFRSSLRFWQDIPTKRRYQSTSLHHNTGYSLDNHHHEYLKTDIVSVIKREIVI
jgi:hypothetical protein